MLRDIVFTCTGIVHRMRTERHSICETNELYGTMVRRKISEQIGYSSQHLFMCMYVCVVRDRDLPRGE